MKKLGGFVCDKVVDKLPLPNGLKADAKVACMAAAGGFWGAIAQTKEIGPEPDRSSTKPAQSKESKKSSSDSKKGSSNSKKGSASSKKSSSSGSVGVLRDIGGHSHSSSSSSSNTIVDKVMADVWRC